MILSSYVIERLRNQVFINLTCRRTTTFLYTFLHIYKRTTRKRAKHTRNRETERQRYQDAIYLLNISFDVLFFLLQFSDGCWWLGVFNYIIYKIRLVGMGVCVCVCVCVWMEPHTHTHTRIKRNRFARKIITRNIIEIYLPSWKKAKQKKTKAAYIKYVYII